MISSFCSSRKWTWATKRAAKKSLTRMRGIGREGMHPYRCRECGLWHVGHRIKGFYQR